MSEPRSSPGFLTLADLRSLLARTNMLLPGLYAWVTTVAYPATAREASGGARTAAVLALLALLAGPFVAFERPRVGRAVGVFGFLGLSVLAWALLGPLVSVGRLEPVRAALGAVGWGAFALGWGAVRRTDAVPEDDPRAIPGDPLVPRRSLDPAAWIALVVGVVGALVPWFLAWRVDRPSHALLAHAVALACAIATLVVVGRIAVERGTWKPAGTPRQRLEAASRPLALLALAFALAVLYGALR